MKFVVVYESMFGNTRTVAEAIAGALRAATEAGAGADVEVHEVGTAPDTLAPDVDLVVVGAPTHAFGMPRESTRRDAADRYDPHLVSAGRGIREWIESVQGAVPRFVTFDTKVRRPRLPGSAARAAARRLAKKGWSEAAPPETFYVDGTMGPLLDGEVDRATEWAARLAATEMGTSASVGGARSDRSFHP